MCGLGHYFEGEGLATTGLSLVREHAEHSRPPRSLWVPFDFGHPLGLPGDSEGQLDVLRQTLALFDRPSGPVLEDWVGDPGSAAEHPEGASAQWSCPIPLAGATAVEDRSEAEQIRTAAEAELAKIMPWYDHAAANLGRTTVGASGLSVDALLPFVLGFLGGDVPPSPREELPLPVALKAACEDLKQVYLEAAIAQPVADGAVAPSHVELNDWFWGETRMAELMRLIAAEIPKLEDPLMGMVSKFLLLPHAQHD